MPTCLYYCFRFYLPIIRFSQLSEPSIARLTIHLGLSSTFELFLRFVRGIQEIGAFDLKKLFQFKSFSIERFANDKIKSRAVGAARSATQFQPEFTTAMTSLTTNFSTCWPVHRHLAHPNFLEKPVSIVNFSLIALKQPGILKIQLAR